MNGTQRTIKHVAIGLGIALAIGIIMGILTLITSIAWGVGIGRGDDRIVRSERVLIQEEISDIYINIGVSRFEIRTGTEFEVVLNDTEARAEEHNGTLRVTENTRRVRFLGFGRNEGQVIIYIPEGSTFESVRINSGVGTVNIRSLVANTVNLSLGVGEVRIDELISNENTRIEGGVGRVVLESGSLRNLSLDSGVGESIINAELLGSSRLETGVGRLRLHLMGAMDEYTIRTQSGIGNVTINGTRHSSGTHGSGANNVQVNGGIGAIEITTEY